MSLKMYGRAGHSISENIEELCSQQNLSIELVIVFGISFLLLYFSIKIVF